MKRILKPAIFVAIGLVIAFPVFSLTECIMVRTTTRKFCAWCHEIRFPYPEASIA
ncbi:MAG: NapC/NirT family cytochrome c [Thermodesulfobacteriota bacterium]|nr:NapC/NirT family cytochrome c [Thermodesulfobacteriota bacterium]